MLRFADADITPHFSMPFRAACARSGHVRYRRHAPSCRHIAAAYDAASAMLMLRFCRHAADAFAATC